MKRNFLWRFIVIFTVSLGLAGFASGAETGVRSQGKHSLAFGYSPVLRSWWYKEWKPVPPLRFSLAYTYDIPMRSRFVNFYAIGEVSYIGAYDRLEYVGNNGKIDKSNKYKRNAVILSAGIGMKVHLVRFLDLAVFYTGGYRYMQDKVRGGSWENWEEEMHDFSGCAGARLIGKIKNFNVFAGYSLNHLAPTQYFPKVEHYVDVGIGYTF
ncbi:MAG: hypothetical protein NC324_05950 [Bacteroides sp.]|nr:hypothetical protein [Bacteroides sp.]MCM1085175.1 hypothetical protein [Bacteroides sp.]MCM1169463.1 hypothetical protein [Bacteroides sp.]